MQQVLQQAAQEIEQLQGALQEAKSGMDAKRLDAETKLQIAHSQQETQRDIAEINADAKKDVAELAGAIQLMAKKLDVPLS
ncbi:hypothetical protein ABK046_46190, partial [Streptomyces caeruleatus]